MEDYPWVLLTGRTISPGKIFTWGEGTWTRGLGEVDARTGGVDAGTGRSGRKDRGSGRGDWAKWTRGPRGVGAGGRDGRRGTS